MNPTDNPTEHPSGTRAAAPRTRPDILVSAPLLRGPEPVRLLLDPRTGARMELSPKVHFVLDRLDGVRTLDQIGEDYAARFGARLGEPQWRQLLGLFYGRRLLVGAEPPEAAAGSATPMESARGHWAEGRLRLVTDGHARFDVLRRLPSPARHRVVRGAAVAALGAALGTLLVGLVWRLPELTASAGALVHRPAMLLLVTVALWLSMALHEIGHALTARAVGATVGELGLRWRLPMVYLYCDVPDARFLPRRRQVAVAAAGALTNLVVLLPAYGVWLLLTRHGGSHPTLSAVLLSGTVVGLANLLPLPPLDGYRILEALLGTTRLAQETRAYVARAALRRRRGSGQGTSGYPRRAKRLYLGYAVLWTTVTAGLLLAVAATVSALTASPDRVLTATLTALAVAAPVALRVVRPARRRGQAVAR
ncbi:M50 family metallopeptidase [Streptacidiphilus melanogenes]|uniref:M50 family metallopeptidase n=1 Tax=Streptacidiphilus melanogenes TaxID=411235 RepID=UPI0006946952|nr:M50 family metallopeptidase [Streptacidiphilus melanogenes]